MRMLKEVTKRSGKRLYRKSTRRMKRSRLDREGDEVHHRPRQGDSVQVLYCTVFYYNRTDL
jgi:hypothetical protein